MNERRSREFTEVFSACIREEVRRALRDFRREADDWVPHTRWPCVSARAARELARSGQLEGVRCIGKGRGRIFSVRRSVLDAWVESHPLVGAAEEDVAEPDEFDREMLKRGLVAGAAGSAPKRQSPPHLSRRSEP